MKSPYLYCTLVLHSKCLLLRSTLSPKSYPRLPSIDSRLLLAVKGPLMLLLRLVIAFFRPTIDRQIQPSSSGVISASRIRSPQDSADYFRLELLSPVVSLLFPHTALHLFRQARQQGPLRIGVGRPLWRYCHPVQMCQLRLRTDR